ncbi:MAG: ATP-dependent Clp protease adaptor ClpS [Bacteroidota bacterium]
MSKEKTKELAEVDVLDAIESGAKVVLYNDDVNTFDWVIECLCEICEHETLQAEQCAMLVHFKGKALVKKGEEDKMKSICQALCDRGLSAVVE